MEKPKTPQAECTDPRVGKLLMDLCIGEVPLKKVVKTRRIAYPHLIKCIACQEWLEMHLTLRELARKEKEKKG